MPLPYPWLNRTFDFNSPVEMYPDLIERLRGAPARLGDQLLKLPRDVLTKKPNDGEWSIQENAGHLLDLEPLPAQRLDDFLARRETLSPWAGNNDATDASNHNEQDIASILRNFRAARTKLVNRLDELPPEDFARTAIHPRLNKPMRLVDFLEFHAQHDDYHLARISQLIRRFAPTSSRA